MSTPLAEKKRNFPISCNYQLVKGSAAFAGDQFQFAVEVERFPAAAVDVVAEFLNGKAAVGGQFRPQPAGAHVVDTRIPYSRSRRWITRVADESVKQMTDASFMALETLLESGLRKPLVDRKTNLRL